MDENFNSFVLRLRNANGDHNYDEYSSNQMVRLNQENDEGDVSQNNVTNDDITVASCINENDGKDTVVSRSPTTCTGPKSSVAIIYPCYLCNFETCRSTSLVAHLRQHRQGGLALETERFQIGKFVCNVCNFKTRWLSSLKEHEQKAHFNNNTNIALNYNNRCKGPPYNCRLCGYSAERLETIGIHMRRHFTSSNVFGNIVLKYPCSLCEFTSKQLDELQNHFSKIHCSSTVVDRRIIEHPSGTSCSKCDHVFINSEDMISHLQKHEENNLPEFPCDYCAHRSASIHLWRDHMESHGGVLEISLASMHH